MTQRNSRTRSQINDLLLWEHFKHGKWGETEIVSQSRKGDLQDDDVESTCLHVWLTIGETSPGDIPQPFFCVLGLDQLPESANEGRGINGYSSG